MQIYTIVIAVVAIVIIAAIVIFTIKYTKNVEVVNKEETRVRKKKYKDLPIRTNKVIDKLNKALSKKQYLNLTEQEKDNIYKNINELQDLLNNDNLEELDNKVSYIENLYKASEKKAIETLKK